MIGTVVAISVISVLGAISEKLVEDEKTKQFIKTGCFGISGALVVGLIVNTIKEVFRQ